MSEEIMRLGRKLADAVREKERLERELSANAASIKSLAADLTRALNTPVPDVFGATRKHATCIDVSTYKGGPGSEYICGPKCPPVELTVQTVWPADVRGIKVGDVLYANSDQSMDLPAPAFTVDMRERAKDAEVDFEE